MRPGGDREGREHRDLTGYRAGGMKVPVVRVARMGGQVCFSSLICLRQARKLTRPLTQYAKPRSKPTEMFEGKEIPSFRSVLPPPPPRPRNPFLPAGTT